MIGLTEFSPIQVVIVYDLDNDNLDAILGKAEIKPTPETSYDVLSYTDTEGRINPYNKNLFNEVQRARIVLLQKSRLGVLDSAVELAIRAVLSAPVEDIDVRFFEDKTFEIYKEPDAPVIELISGTQETKEI